ncbi:MAG: DUF1538 domain-containing protein [Marinilabiliales bacterium]|nr:MAG: DUF1538 domain-containing protein [Marinilabiliales bacterium]
MIERKKIPLLDAVILLYGYARTRIVEQVKAVAFIIFYLVVFQTLILGVPIANALGIAGGIAMVVFGLAFFLEGLVLGLMPLGERVGVKLPTKTTIYVIALFGLLLGFGSTLAEPAISALRTAGAGVRAWESPLLYMLLERNTEQLVLSIGAGVGIAVCLGMFRFYYNLSIKPFIYIIMPLVLTFSIIVSFNDNIRSIIGLAWDSGAVTTGAVTVPLVLALGIGVSRASSKGKGSSGEFGIILLASLFPILAVLTLGSVLSFKAPEITSEERFFSPAQREQALYLFDSEAELSSHAFTHGTETGRRAFYPSEKEYLDAMTAFTEDPDFRFSLIGEVSLADWIIDRASEFERTFIAGADLSGQRGSQESLGPVLKEETMGGARAVIPLSIMLILVLVLLRERIRYKDEVALGLVFTLIGMTLLTSGIRLGLGTLGGEVGGQLPRAFATEEKFVDRVMIDDFDPGIVYSVITTDGTKRSFFDMLDNGQITPVEFHENRFDLSSGTYEHIITRTPLFDSRLTVFGIILVLLFAFGLGFGATLAEPALNALGMTVENLTVGTIKQSKIVRVVSIGVGTGILLGLARILFDIPLLYLLVPPYLLLLPLTYLSEEDFTAIAWDSGGVTTGPVTVPLVLAMGLSVGAELNVVDGFGILAMASVFPIITVLTYGLIMKTKQQKSLDQHDEDDDDDEVDISENLIAEKV